MTTVSLVGMYHRPPAIAVLSCLPLHTKLSFIREPSNSFDPNAIQVWCQTTDINHKVDDGHEEVFERYGSSIEEVLESPSLMLGYVAARETHLVPMDCHCGALVYKEDGKPAILLQEPVNGENL